MLDRALSPRHGLPPAHLAAAVGLLLLVTGCASTQPPAPSLSAPEQQAAERQLRAETGRWAGTPYLIGGESRRGIDCSAFVQQLYGAVFGMPLPRTTRRQVRQGRAVPRDQLQTGDLVFFRTSYTTRHVGVYLSGGEFAHASSSRGVTVSRLDAPYWRARYWTARRVLPAAEPIPTAPPQPVPTSTLPTAAPVRW